MATISLCMIVKNEADTLPNCLESVKDLVDEINIADTGSSDNTVQIARRYTNNVYEFKWIDDFSAARNFAFSKATKDFIFILDADDVLLPADREGFKQLKDSLNPTIDGVMMRYNAGFDENGTVTLFYYRERLTQRIKNHKWMEPVHEYLDLRGNIIFSDVAVTHKKLHPSEAGRNLRIYEKYVADGRELSPRGLYYYGRELYSAGRSLEATVKLNRFLECGQSWVEDRIGACVVLSKCYGALGDSQNRLKSLLRSFEQDIPRAEVLCELGYYYTSIGDFKKAKYWFEAATKLEKPTGNAGFQYLDYYDYVPYIELCVCCDRLGLLEESFRYNELAGQVKPGNASVESNRRYFESRKILAAQAGD